MTWANPMGPGRPMVAGKVSDTPPAQGSENIPPRIMTLFGRQKLWFAMSLVLSRTISHCKNGFTVFVVAVVVFDDYR